MASLNTLRTKYGIVLSVVIALVLVAFILGDRFTFRGGDEAQNQVAVKVNGKAITEQKFAEMGGNMAAVLCENYYGPELKNVGLTFEDEMSMRTQFAATLMAQNPSMSRDDVNMSASGVDINSLNINSAQQSVELVLGASYYNNKLDLAAYEAEAKNSVSGRYVEYPYTAAEDVEVTDEEVKARYDELTLPNGEYGARTFMYVEFPHVEAVEGEEAETPDQRDARIESFRISLGDTPDTFKATVDAAGLSFLSKTAKVAELSRGIYPFGSFDLAYWAHNNAVVGDTNKFTVGDTTYVVMIESVDENQKLPYEDCEASLRTLIANEKKYEAIAATMPASLEGLAEVVEFNDVTFDTNAYDPHLVAAIFAAEAGDVVKVKGQRSAYLVVVDEVNDQVGDVAEVANSYYDELKPEFIKRASNAFKLNLNVEYVNESYRQNMR